jgi:integrase
LETVRKEPLSVRKEGLSPRTLTKLLFVGGAVCERAHREWPGYAGNPFRPIEIFTPEEAAAIVRAAETEQDEAIFRLDWRTGLRRGEIPPLLVGDVQGRMLHVRRNFVHGVITTPKGKRERFVPLNRTVAQSLAKLLNARGNPSDDELLFPGTEGASKVAYDPENLLGRGHGAHVSGLLDPDALRRRFKAAMTKARVKPPLSMKHLRHTYCSHSAARGSDPWKIQEWAGHASITTTQMYVQVFAPKDDHADLVDAAYDEPLAEAQPTTRRRARAAHGVGTCAHPEQVAEALTLALTRQGATG